VVKKLRYIYQLTNGSPENVFIMYSLNLLEIIWPLHSTSFRSGASACFLSNEEAISCVIPEGKIKCSILQ